MRNAIEEDVLSDKLCGTDLNDLLSKDEINKLWIVNSHFAINSTYFSLSLFFIVTEMMVLWWWDSVYSMSLHFDFFFFFIQMLPEQLNYWKNCRNLEKYQCTSYSPSKKCSRVSFVLLFERYETKILITIFCHMSSEQKTCLFHTNSWNS